MGTTFDGTSNARPFTVGVSLSQFRTELSFDGEGARLRQTQLSVPMSWRLGDLTLSATGALIADGDLVFDAARGAEPDMAAPLGVPYRFGFQTGGAVGLGLSWRVLQQIRDDVDLILGVQLAYAHTVLRGRDDAAPNTASSATWNAFDLRVSATVSRTFGGALTPWFSVRLFGGPVMVNLKGDARRTRAIVGSDIRHIQLAAGVAVVPLPARAPGWRIFAEGAALSERGFTLGTAVAF